MKRIVCDSSSNQYRFEGVDYAYAPLVITVDGRDYVDNETLDVNEMITALESTKSKSSTACPGIGDWLDKFEGADEIYAITISSKLSGSYNSAMAEL